LISSPRKIIMNINQLPELCMQRIFSNQTFYQQIQNLQVCNYWNSIQARLFQVQKSLTLLIGSSSLNQFQQRISKSDFVWQQQQQLNRKSLSAACLKYLPRAFEGSASTPTANFL